MSKKTAPYGTWPSPITPDAVLQSGSNVEEVFVDPITSTVYHIEARPSEGGRSVIVKTEEGSDVVGKEWNTRTGVQEYGGAPAIAYNGVVYFSNYVDSRVYMVRSGGQPEPITPANENHRFAKFAIHPKQPQFLVAIMEDHTKPMPADVITTLCLINSKTQTVSTLVSGADFYTCPCFSPDGTRLGWQQWFHPDMPWEGAEIYVGNVSADESSLTLSHITYVAGKKLRISASFPSWASNDVLLFTSDQSGYQNPWKFSVSTGKASPVLSAPVEQDFGLPAWWLSWEWYTPLDQEASRALFMAMKGGRSILYVVNLRSGVLEEIQCPYVTVMVIKRITHDSVVFMGEKSDAPKGIVLCTLKDYSKPQFTKLGKTLVGPQISSSYISVAQSITLKVPPNDEPLHVVYFPPTHPDYTGPKNEKPPVVVNSHGGPTGHTSQGLEWTKQYFTSRGWSWLDVQYGGSDAYGRKYIERLTGKWGIVDVQDCARAMKQLSAPPYSLVDSQRSAIRGESAGGFTALATLCFEPDAFAAGTSLYGVADLGRLAEDTHKFESHYLEKLVGGTVKEVAQVYKERSPIYNADKIKVPLLVLQGADDPVVPPSQAKEIVEAVKSRGGRVEFTIFDGEGHGWRKAETIRAALEQELAFYEGVFGLVGMKKA